MKDAIAIPFKKKKFMPFILGVMIFVLAGIFLIYGAIQAKNQTILQIFIIVVGLSIVLFFGLIACVMLPKLFSHKLGLVIGDDGLFDDTTAVAAGLINWHDIKKIQFSYSGSNTFLIVMVKNPNKYMNRETNLLKKWAMRINYKISGSPIKILVSLLDVDFYTLNEQIANKGFATKTNTRIDL
jgi:hypothetical protein